MSGILPLWLLIVLIVVWGGYAVFSYRMGSRALRRKPVAGFTVMVGSRGQVVNALAPEGMINIRGELWRAVSAGESITEGEEVEVVGQDGLRLVVCPGRPDETEGE